MLNVFHDWNLQQKKAKKQGKNENILIIIIVHRHRYIMPIDKWRKSRERMPNMSNSKHFNN